MNFKIAADYDWLLKVFFVNNEKVKYCELDVIIMEDGGISNSSFQSIIKSNLESLICDQILVSLASNKAN